MAQGALDDLVFNLALLGIRKLHNNPLKRATYTGFGALGIWTVEPLLISEVNSLPIFEVLAIIFFSSFVITAFRLTKQKKWNIVLRQPLFVWLVGISGICLSDFAYIYGAQHAPIAHVDLIDYIWPCLVVGFTGLLPREKLLPHHIIGSLLGIIGIFVLVQHELGQGFNFQYCFGYILALLGAFLWSGYSVFSRYHKQLPTEMIGMYCGLGAILCMVLHLQFETFVIPTFTEASLAVITGVTGAGIAYQLWDYAVKFGNIYILSSSTYIARITAMALLVIFGKEPLTISLVLACFLTSMGVYITSLDASSFKHLYKKFFPFLSDQKLLTSK